MNAKHEIKEGKKKNSLNISKEMAVETQWYDHNMQSIVAYYTPSSFGGELFDYKKPPCHLIGVASLFGSIILAPK